MPMELLFPAYKILFTFGETNRRLVMDLILPTNQNTSVPVTLDTKVLVVIGANGAGKSSFGRNLHQRYAGQIVWISGINSLFLHSEVSNTPAVGNDLA